MVGTGLTLAGAIMFIRRRGWLVGALAIAVTCSALVAVGRLRPPETLSQRGNDLAAEIPCPHRSCAGMSIEEAIRQGRWRRNVVESYWSVASAVQAGLAPDEVRAYVSTVAANRRGLATVPPHVDGHSGD